MTITCLGSDLVTLTVDESGTPSVRFSTREEIEALEKSDPAGAAKLLKYVKAQRQAPHMPYAGTRKGAFECS